MKNNLLSQSERRYDFDWLRTWSTLLVFLFHTSQPFSYNKSWPIHNKEQCSKIDSLIISMDSWIMPLFMWLAGASTWHALQKRTTAEFVQDRIKRLLVPCVLGTLLLCPPQSYFRQRLHNGDKKSFIHFYPQFFGSIYPEGHLSYYHLWFQAYLFAYTLLALPIFISLQRKASHPPTHHLPNDRGTKQAGMLMVFAVPIIAGQVALRRTFPKTYFIINDWSSHALLFPIFLAGYIGTSDKRFEQAIDHIKTPMVALALVSTIAMYMRTLIGQSTTYIDPQKVDQQHRSAQKWFASEWAIFALCAWSSVIATSGFGRKYGQRNTTLLSYAKDATGPCYILHQPVIVTVAYYIVQQNMPIAMKFLLINAHSFIITLGLYELAKRWKATRIVLGMVWHVDLNTQRSHFKNLQRS